MERIRITDNDPLSQGRGSELGFILIIKFLIHAQALFDVSF